MKTTLILTILSALPLCSCSSFDFFDYQNKTGLYAIGRPEGYDSAKLGTEMAPTGTAEFDLLAASGGLGTATVVYKMSADNKPRNVTDPFESYMDKGSEGKERERTGTGASLAGLPDWGGRDSGCVAIGEPNMKQVVLRCISDPEKSKIIRLSASTSGGDLTDFGHDIAAIPPESKGGWSLAVAARRHMWVVSDDLDEETNRTEAFLAEKAGGVPAGEVLGIGAGRLGQRFFVSALVGDQTADPRAYVFLQESPGGKKVAQKLCIETPDAAPFSGSIATGDIDGDGADELVLSAGLGEVGTKKVYIYDIASLISGVSGPGAENCGSGMHLPQIVLEPEEGDRDIDCEDSCHFGAALALGEISTEDAFAEIVVGAPEASVNGTKEAGAVYIYTVTDWASGLAELSSQVAHSTPSKGHWFGGGLTITPLAGRNELVIATTGKGNLYVAFCTGVGEDIKSGADVPTNAGGSVVSTRCRL